MKKKILMIYTDWNNNDYRIKKNLYGGVGYYRLVLPGKYLKEYFDVDIVGSDLKKFGKTAEEMWHNVFTQYDLVFTKQFDNVDAGSKFLFFADYYKKPIVIDIDDNYFEVCPDQPAWNQYQPGTQKRAMFGAMISLADGLSLSTYPLADYYKNRIKKVYNEEKEVFVMPNCNDVSEFNHKLAKKDKNKVIIGWAGSITHNKDLELVMPVLNKLLLKYPNLYLEFLGGIETKNADTIFRAIDECNFDRVKMKAGVPAWDKFPKLMCNQPWDIGIAPLVDTEFNKGKSHIKWLEYSNIKIPTVASKVYPYFEEIDGTKTIEDGVTGYLASNDKEWEEKLTLLIENKELREKIGNQAYEYVKEEWDIKKHIHKLVDSINSLLK